MRKLMTLTAAALFPVSGVAHAQPAGHSSPIGFFIVVGIIGVIVVLVVWNAYASRPESEKRNLYEAPDKGGGKSPFLWFAFLGGSGSDLGGRRDSDGAGGDAGGGFGDGGGCGGGD